MALRPTLPKITKLKVDLDKIVSRLYKEASTLTSYRTNPMGTDMQIVAGLATPEEKIRTAAALLREAEAELETSLGMLTRRKNARA